MVITLVIFNVIQKMSGKKLQIIHRLGFERYNIETTFTFDITYIVHKIYDISSIKHECRY